MANPVGDKRPGNREAVIRTRFTDDERDMVERAAEGAGLTRAAFMREAALNAAKGEQAHEATAKAGPQPASPLERETVLHLRKVGTNLNQIARAVNAGKVHFDHLEARDLLLEINDLVKDINALTNARGV